MKKLCLVFLLIFSPLILLAKVDVTKKVAYYNINPKSKKDIKSELLKKTPVKKAGKKRYANTTWSIYPSYEFKGACRVTKVFIELNITTVLPRLNPKKNIKYSVKSPFQKFERKLTSYQKSHEKFAIQAAKEIEKKVLSYGAPKNCDQMKKDRRKAIKRINNKYKRKSADLDKKTDFGRKKGVKI